MTTGTPYANWTDEEIDTAYRLFASRVPVSDVCNTLPGLEIPASPTTDEKRVIMFLYFHPDWQPAPSESVM